MRWRDWRGDRKGTQPTMRTTATGVVREKGPQRKEEWIAARDKGGTGCDEVAEVKGRPATVRDVESTKRERDFREQKKRGYEKKGRRVGEAGGKGGNK
jgi:hypothetical protein